MKSPRLYKKPLILILAAIFSLAAYFAIEYGTKKYYSDQNIKNHFQHNLLIQQESLIQKALSVQDILTSSDKNHWPQLEKLLDPDHVFAQIYFHDSLLFWNSNKVSNDLDYLKGKPVDTIVQEKTAWYLIHFTTSGNYRIFLFKLIKTEYPFENKYLPSISNKEFLLSNHVRLLTDPKEAQYIIFNKQGKPFIGLTIEHHNDIGPTTTLLLFFVYLLFYIFIILFIHSLYDSFGKAFANKRWAFFSFILDLFLIRFLDYYFGYPVLLKHSFLFEIRFNLCPGLNSIGDLYLSVILLLAIFIKFNHLVQSGQIAATVKYKYGQHFIAWLVLWMLALGVFYSDYFIISGLSTNPVIGIQLSNPVNILSVLFVVLQNIVLFFMVRSVNYYSLKHAVNFWFRTIFIIFLTIVFYFIFVPLLIVWVTAVFAFLISIVIELFSENVQAKFLKYLIYLIIFASANAIIINVAESRSKDMNQALTAGYLMHKDDPELENTFAEFEKEVKKDTVISMVLDNYWDDPEMALKEYLQSKYFKHISFKYDLQVTVCHENELLEIQPEGVLTGCADYFNDLIHNSGDTTNVPNLFLQNSTPESIYYMGKVTIPSLKHKGKTPVIYMEFYFTYVPEGVGYPELLVDNSTLSYDLSGYSFAKYSELKLVYKFGDYAYHTSYSSMDNFPMGVFYNHGGYRHLKLISKDGDILIISRPIARIQEKLATFSVLFLLMGLVTFFIFILVFNKNVFTVFLLSFRTRLQVFFIATISIIIFVIAIIIAYYAEYSNKERITDQLDEKTHSVLIELQHKLGSAASAEEIKPDELYPMLRKFSMVFFSDINVFDPSGKLIASSRPEIFRMGLLSDLINPLSYEEIYVDNKLFYTTKEKIGTLSYYSSYVPFLGEKGPLGIVNLPYFARQTEVKMTYYMMIFAFLNIFVIAGILGIFLAILLSRVLTKPLLVLQHSLSRIRIDERNERIAWESDDEIGLLIKAYNQMVDKLEESAELLKHSERESAWREVARQIAHEIKNPLTPMKLNVQYLEKSYNENDPAQKDKIHSISQSLIQQIDALNKVAEMFSDFAKSNIRRLEKVDLLEIINSSVMLFKNNDRFNISLVAVDDHYYIKGIEKDILRLFNNLIKNAVQSLEGKEDGQIKITVERSDHFIEVTVADNGKGIDEELKSRIFRPYFTTKSGGTGLGLAIVKNIMNEIGGSVTFKSESTGTTFFLKFQSPVN